MIFRFDSFILEPPGSHRTSWWIRWTICITIIFALVTTQTQAAELEKLQDCTLVPTEWADGDSFLVRTLDKQEYTVRLYGADCIERHVTDATDERRLRTQRNYFGITNAKPDPRASIDLAKGYGEKAAQEIRKMLAKPFTIHTSFADAQGDGRHKRIYAFVVTSDGTDLAAHLVSEGLARAFGVFRQTLDGRTQQEYREFLADLELQAAKRGAGVWAVTDWEKLPEERKDQRRADREVELALDSRPLAVGSTINPNTAARDELMKLPGIGEELANRIIEARPYQKPEDLLRVSGIGPSTLARIRPHLEFSTSEPLP